MNNRIDPLFNNPNLNKKVVVANAAAKSNQLTSATETPPKSINKKPMQLVEGAYNGKKFLMWVDLTERSAIPVREK
jgi:hypothetical protein